MTQGPGQVQVSDDLLRVMRGAAQIAVRLHEPFVTVRSLALALLDEPVLGTALESVLPRPELEAYELPADAASRLTASRIAETGMSDGERAAIARFDTIAFKVPDGTRSVWLSREALGVWVEGAKRASESEEYLPKHLALGIAADAMRSGGVLAALHLEPGAITDAVERAEREEKKR